MAKYKIIPSSRTIVQSPISIGHKAEKGVEAIEFDLTAWVETYGSGTLTVIMRRWGDAIPYPIALEIDENNKATWTLSDIDTAKVGMAYAQLNYIVGDEVVKKSDIYTFRVMDSLTGEGEPPEAYESWLEHLTHLAAEAMAEVLDIEGIVTDKTLTVDGGIADAKAAGDALALKADKSTTYTKTEVDQMIEDVEVETDTTLTISGAAADAAETGRQIGSLKADLGAVDDSLIANRSGTLVLNPMAFYRYTRDGVTAVDFSTMPLNSYVYAQFSVVKSALINANFPLSWSDTDYIHMVRLAAGNNSVPASIISVFNFAKTQSAEMLYVPDSSGNKYRWLLPTTDFTKEYLPAEAKAVGDALALKSDLSALVNGRTNIVLNPFGGVARNDVGGDVDFRTFPMNTYCSTTYQYIKQGFADTNFPDNDWADSDYVTIIKRQVSTVTSVGNSIITVFNFNKTRKLEMLYYASTSGNKYRWITGSGGTNYNTFENTINQYSDTYNVTASPSITTDTNNYLQPAGDSTDMASAIVAMLTQTGVCNLAPGDFYVSGIDMPDNTAIRGCGTATNIILLDSTTDGYAIKMGSRCLVDSVMISGGTSAPTITSTIGTRNGILWQGTVVPGDTNLVSAIPMQGAISNCYIRWFSGSGLHCFGTGTGTSNCLNVANSYFRTCAVGINIAWLSEFHRVANVDCRGCYYGIINNGGNNMFANCGFSKNIIGLLMDNTYGQSNNNSHGSFSNCVFNHSGNNNDGVAIHIIGCTNGEIFTGCQLFYGEIVIEESEGIVFANCNFGGSSGTQISITNGGLIMYNGCCFKSVPTVTKSGNTATKFVNCYLRDGTAVTIS